MAKKKATAKKRAAVKRAAPKPPAPEPSPVVVEAPAVRHFKDVSWEWAESRLVASLDPKRPMYSLQIDFGREILSAECSLGGSGIGPKVEGSSIFLRCNNGPLEIVVKLAEGKQQDPVLSDWAI